MVLLYYLSQNPDFAESVKPIMTKLKDSEQMLSFLKDLSNFSKVFGGSTPDSHESTKKESEDKNSEKEKNPSSPTKGIADEFIQNILDSYLKQK